MRTLYELVEALSGIHRIEPFKVEARELFRRDEEEVDFGDVRGQENVKRAIEIAAAGGQVKGGYTMPAIYLVNDNGRMSFSLAVMTSNIPSRSGVMGKAALLK